MDSQQISGPLCRRPKAQKPSNCSKRIRSFRLGFRELRLADFGLLGFRVAARVGECEVVVDQVIRSIGGRRCWWPVRFGGGSKGLLARLWFAIGPFRVPASGRRWWRLGGGGPRLPDRGEVVGGGGRRTDCAGVILSAAERGTQVALQNSSKCWQKLANANLKT
ncbi:hypothetical protein Cgig2_015651 [Carnegiea gigantea]|uniref:Uncharacterized protein n=1 Tax=Carnegiea gigantea TaxID=171969 RepID=A0A9Q1Q8D1_9CARY|nr:hypothetical protein Cgig2_015651 [Carnegiea gigantea]